MWLVVAGLVGAFAGISFLPSRFRLPLWTTVIILVVVPWLSTTDHAHWSRIGWIPFRSPPIRLRDILINGILYVPFGWFSRCTGRTRRRHVILVTVWALGLSIATEATQIYSHGRFPSMTDVVMNGLGACLGAMGSAVRSRSSR